MILFDSPHLTFFTSHVNVYSCAWGLPSLSPRGATAVCKCALLDTFRTAGAEDTRNIRLFP